jgi:hypothetical protein
MIEPLMQPCLILIFCSAFRPPSSSTHGELTDSCSYIRLVSCTPHTQVQKQITDFQLLSSYTLEHTGLSRKHFSLHLQINYKPRAQALIWESFSKIPDLPVTTSFLSLLLLDVYSRTTILGLPGAAEKSGIQPNSLGYNSHTLTISLTTLLL